MIQRATSIRRSLQRLLTVERKRLPPPLNLRRRSPLPADEQQALQQLPEGHPAGQQTAEGLQPQGRGGPGHVPAARPTRRLRDSAQGSGPQVVL